jgi:ketosteroid isomerase-like protein
VAQVLEVFRRTFELTEGTFRADTHDVLANDEHVVVLYTGHAQRADKILADHVALVIHMRDGKQAEIWLQNTDLYANDEFLS